MTAARSRYVALLRGINVGGKHRLPMAELVALCEAVGCAAVTTYIQSGNVVFTATAPMAARLPQRLAAQIVAATGLEVPVVVRSAAELAWVPTANPLGDHDPDQLHVMFLAEPPTARQVAALDPARSPPDRFAVVGRDLYLRLPNGVARTKLTNAYFDAKLGTVSTGRNWNTVRKLIELTSDT